jgi:hypothetical protein
VTTIQKAEPLFLTNNHRTRLPLLEAAELPTSESRAQNAFWNRECIIRPLTLPCRVAAAISMSGTDDVERKKISLFLLKEPTTSLNGKMLLGHTMKAGVRNDENGKDEGNRAPSLQTWSLIALASFWDFCSCYITVISVMFTSDSFINYPLYIPIETYIEMGHFAKSPSVDQPPISLEFLSLGS